MVAESTLSVAGCPLSAFAQPSLFALASAVEIALIRKK